MKRNYLKYSVLLFVTINLFTPVSARDTEGNDTDCPTCNMLEAPHNIDYEAVEYYQSLSDNAATFNSREAAKNPFSTSRSVLRASVVSQGWANSGITRYYQTDYNDLLCPNTSNIYTIASHGCVVTSFAMIATKYGINVTPMDVRTRLNADAPGNESACNFPWFNIVTVTPFTSLTAQEITNHNWDTAFNNIEGAILSNRPVLAFMEGPTGTHAVVVYGFEHYSDGGEFHYIFNSDPQNEYHQMSLQEYRRDGWSIERLMVYYR